MAAPKPIIDLMLAEKYGWTPQEIDDIPHKWMEEMMLTLNARLNINAELEMRRDKLGENIKGASSPSIGGGSFRPNVGGRVEKQVL